MYVQLSAGRTITLEDRDNFRAFKLVVQGDAASLDEARQALAGLAVLEDAARGLDFPGGAARPAGGPGQCGLATGLRRDDRKGAAARLDRRRARDDQGACRVGSAGLSAGPKDRDQEPGYRRRRLRRPPRRL